MYLQITNYCNMSCPHCCYSATRKKSESKFMTMETVRSAMQWYFRPAEVGRIWHPDIGGGEPTCHPLFWDILLYVLDRWNETGNSSLVWMVTNGKLRQRALQLADMARRGLLRVGLSQDEWHDPVSPEVVQAFRKDPVNSQDKRFFQNVGKRLPPIRSGRCDWGLPDCNGWGRPWVLPDGSVRQCGCLDAPIVGNVFDGFHPINNRWDCFAGRPHHGGEQIQFDMWGRKIQDAPVVDEKI